MTINGLLVVRMPHLNYLLRERDVVPHINGVYYAGVDRQRWVDVLDEDYYAGNTPNTVRELAVRLKPPVADFTGIDVCQDVNDAYALLNYSNRKSPANELIAIQAPSLDPVMGAIQCKVQIEWLGYDFVRLGEWSLIAAGVFMCPQDYLRWIDLLNTSGLLADPSLLTAYVYDYERAAAEGLSEPLAASPKSHTVAIRIGRVRK